MGSGVPWHTVPLMDPGCSVWWLLSCAPKTCADGDLSVHVPVQISSFPLCSGWSAESVSSCMPGAGSHPLWLSWRGICFTAVCCLRAQCMWKGLKEVLSRAWSLKETSSHLCISKTREAKQNKNGIKASVLHNLASRSCPPILKSAHKVTIIQKWVLTAPEKTEIFLLNTSPVHG